MTEKLCLQWNDFKANAVSAFARLREDNDFSDVTLVCEDGQQVEAHKVILAVSSPFFASLLKKNKHQHPDPLVYMRGYSQKILWRLLTFFTEERPVCIRKVWMGSLPWLRSCNLRA